MLKETLGNASDWSQILSREIEQPYFYDLDFFLSDEYQKKTIYPKSCNIFKALELTSPENVKVIIMGQDPYHGNEQANGLAFSVNKGVRIPPSLNNILKELSSDLNIKKPKDGDLTNWAKQGVLLLNNTLTVESGKPLSHHNKGWEKFTSGIIQFLNHNFRDLIFVLWGKQAAMKEPYLSSQKHFILKSAHPSPFSAHRGFFGSKPFSKINRILAQKEKKIINWELPA